jgi:hypothetical protein
MPGNYMRSTIETSADTNALLSQIRDDESYQQILSEHVHEIKFGKKSDNTCPLIYIFDTKQSTRAALTTLLNRRTYNQASFRALTNATVKSACTVAKRIRDMMGDVKNKDYLDWTLAKVVRHFLDGQLAKHVLNSTAMVTFLRHVSRALSDGGYAKPATAMSGIRQASNMTYNVGQEVHKNNIHGHDETTTTDLDAAGFIVQEYPSVPSDPSSAYAEEVSV